MAFKKILPIRIASICLISALIPVSFAHANLGEAPKRSEFAEPEAEGIPDTALGVSSTVTDPVTLVAGKASELKTNWKNFPACKKIADTVRKTVSGNAECFLKLFAIESGCRDKKAQKAGNAGNRYAAYGLCSMEKPPRSRPRICSKWDLVSQIKCCDIVMSQFSQKGSYFGPVRRGSVPKCS